MYNYDPSWQDRELLAKILPRRMMINANQGMLDPSMDPNMMSGQLPLPPMMPPGTTNYQQSQNMQRPGLPDPTQPMSAVSSAPAQALPSQRSFDPTAGATPGTVGRMPQAVPGDNTSPGGGRGSGGSWVLEALDLIGNALYGAAVGPQEAARHFETQRQNRAENTLRSRQLDLETQRQALAAKHEQERMDLDRQHAALQTPEMQAKTAGMEQAARLSATAGQQAGEKAQRWLDVRNTPEVWRGRTALEQQQYIDNGVYPRQDMTENFTERISRARTPEERQKVLDDARALGEVQRAGQGRERENTADGLIEKMPDGTWKRIKVDGEGQRRVGVNAGKPGSAATGGARAKLYADNLKILADNYPDASEEELHRAAMQSIPGMAPKDQTTNSISDDGMKRARNAALSKLISNHKDDTVTDSFSQVTGGIKEKYWTEYQQLVQANEDETLKQERIRRGLSPVPTMQTGFTGTINPKRSLAPTKKDIGKLEPFLDRFEARQAAREKK